jgi:hypothetical protein
MLITRNGPPTNDANRWLRIMRRPRRSSAWTSASHGRTAHPSCRARARPGYGADKRRSPDDADGRESSCDATVPAAVPGLAFCSRSWGQTPTSPDLHEASLVVAAS